MMSFTFDLVRTLLVMASGECSSGSGVQGAGLDGGIGEESSMEEEDGSSMDSEPEGPHTHNENVGKGSESTFTSDEDLSRKGTSRKRTRTPEAWKKSKRKRRRNTGKRYRFTANKMVSMSR